MKSVNTWFNVLGSFAYSGKSKRFNDTFIALNRECGANLMIDSGAFSAFNNKGFDHVTVDNYCQYLEKNADYAQKYVMLDVVGNDPETKKNYELMVSRGFAPMFVFTMRDMDYSYAVDTMKVNRHICVAGGATTKGDWLVQRYQRVLKATNNLARIHGLAFVTFPKMMQIGLESVDSSSWVQGATAFGNCGFFTPTGLRMLHRTKVIDLLKKRDKTTIETLDRLKVSPSVVANPDCFRGFDSVALYLMTRACMEMQKYVYRRGLRQFLAASNELQTFVIRWHYENWDNPSYDKYLKDIRNRTNKR